MKKTFLFFILFLAITSCQNKQAMEELEKYRQAEADGKNNIEVVKHLYKLIDEQNLEACLELFTPDSKGYMGSSEESFAFADIIPFIQMYYSAFPDYSHHTEDIFAAGDYVVTRQKYTGTHTNAFMGVEPTGNYIEYKGIFIFRFSKGKIAEFWGVEDDLTMWGNLGITLPVGEPVE